MQKLKNRILAISIAILLMLSMSASLKLLPNAKAVTPVTLPNVQTWAYLTVEPSTIGVGQQLAIVMWLYNIPPFSISGTIVFQGYTVTVKLPDNTSTTLGPYASDDIAANEASYTPTETGNYSFVFNFPGQQMNNTYGLAPPATTPTANTQTFNEYYEPSTSVTVIVTVQTAPVEQYPFTSTPLPYAYWQSPVEGNTAMYGWSAFTGNWLDIPQAIFGYVCDTQNQNYNPYSIGPSTAHVLWRTQIATEGQVGGSFGPEDYYTGSSYEEKMNNKIIMNGDLYYNLPVSDNTVGGGAVCVNLATGKQLWWQNITLTFGQTWEFNSPNQGGVIALLWGVILPSPYTRAGQGSYCPPAVSNTQPVTYSVYDPETGDQLTQFNNGLYGKFLTLPNGEIDEYFMGNNWIAMWNSTLCFQNNGMIVYSENTGINAEWRPINPGTQYPAGTSTVQFPPLSWNWMKGMQWNTTVPTVVNQAIAQLSTDVILAVGYNSTSISATQNSDNGPGWDCVVGYSAVNGAPLWNYTITPYVGDAVDLYSPIVNDTYAYYNQALMTWNGYSAHTGQKIWGPSPLAGPDNWAFYEQSYAGCGPPPPQIANGVMYVSSYAYVSAFNFTNGDLLWTWQSPSTGLATPYGFESNYGGVMIAGNGLIYQATDEHSLNAALYPTEDLWCINATTGKAVWYCQGVDSGEILADGRLVSYDYCDGYVYCWGPGLTATTVTASPGQGNIMTIQGTVTDQSPGQTCIGIPAAGTPAVSDASMDQWTAYLYQQQAEPTNATGVPVTLTYTDPNNNAYTMGTTTTDLTGHYGYKFNPTIPGLYTVTATFAGSNAYYSSSEETSFTYASPAATAAPTTTPTSVADMYFVPAIAGIIILIIIVLIVVVLLMLRKHP